MFNKHGMFVPAEDLFTFDSPLWLAIGLSMTGVFTWMTHAYASHVVGKIVEQPSGALDLHWYGL